MSQKPRAEMPPPHIVTWEITRRCNLSCPHCRASAVNNSYEGELTTQEGYRLIDSILELGMPMLIFTGGEPLLRGDIFELARYATNRGLSVSLGSNGTLVTEEIANEMKQVPISRLSVSIDFPEPKMQDRFRGAEGAFNNALRGIQNARRAGLEVQINSTITKLNVRYFDALLSLAIEVGAVAFHPFLLVPTGRGKQLKDGELSPIECERIIHWVNERDQEIGEKISFKPTCAPFYWRVMQQRIDAGGSSGGDGRRGTPGSLRRGCLAGISFCFISHVGRVQGCGYLDVEAGDIKRRSFDDIWQSSLLFTELRHHSRLKGKCGACEYKVVCGGCRARAYEATGDYLEAEPCCVYQPPMKK